MRRKKLISLYTVETKTDPRTGKDKRVATYTGKRFRIDNAARRKALPLMWGAVVLTVAAFLVGGLINNPGSRSMFVMPFYIFCLIPIFYQVMAVVHLTRMGEVITEVEQADGVHSAKHCALGLLVLGALWTVADIVFLLVGGAAEQIALELVFLGCGLAMVAGGWLMHLSMRRIVPEEIEEERPRTGSLQDVVLSDADDQKTEKKQ